MKTINIKKILVPIDFSELSTYAVEYALQIARIHSSRIILVHVIEDVLSFTMQGEFVLGMEVYIEKQEYLHQLKTEQMDKFAARMRNLFSHDFESKILFGKSHRAINDFVKEDKIDLLVMSTHGVSGFREFIIGSNAVRIITECPCPVLSVQKPMSNYSIKKILLSFKDDPYSRQKVNVALQFAKWFDAEIFILGIDTENEDSHMQKIKREGIQVKEYLDSFDVKNNLTIVKSSNVPKTILKYADEKDIDLITVMADMESEDVVEFIMGPVAQQLVNHSKRPVLSVQPSRHPDTIDLHPYGW